MERPGQISTEINKNEDPLFAEALVEVLLERTRALVRHEGRDLSLRQMAILLVCEAADDHQTVRGLAAHLAIAKPAVTRAVNRLQTAGLVRRKADPSDRRSVLIAPTASGRRYATRFFGRVRAGTTMIAAEAPAGTVMAFPQRPLRPLLSPVQVREARDLLGWSESRLAGLVEMTPRSVARFERSKLKLSPNDLKSIRDVLETAGVVFTDENNNGMCVRLNKQASKDRQ